MLFYPSEKLALFIDGANLYGAAKGLQFDIDYKRLLELFATSEEKASFPLLAAYDHVLKCSNLFNTLDARGAISVTERVGVIGRVRRLAVDVASSWVEQAA